MKVIITQPTFFPYSGYFAAMQFADKIIFLDDVQFEKRSWQSRNIISTSMGLEYISIPTQNKGVFSQKINEVLLHEPKKSKEKIIKTIYFNYKNFKYFNKYFPEIESVLKKDHEKLIDLNLAIINLGIKFLNIKIKTVFSSSFNVLEKKEKLIENLALTNKAKEVLSTEGVKNYLTNFKSKKINHRFFNYRDEKYDFEKSNFRYNNLSFIDLIFKRGSESSEIMKSKIFFSHTKEKNILIQSFTPVKFPLHKFISSVWKKYSSTSKVYVGNMSNDKHFKHLENVWITPKSSKKNLKKIISGCKARNISYILPTSDIDLQFWAKYKNFFKKNKIKILISNFNIIKIFQDKFLFFKFLKKNKLFAIESFLSFEKIKKKLKNKKIIIKERFSADKGPKVIINFKDDENLKKKLKLFKNPLIQKFEDGYEVSVDAVFDKNFKLKDYRVRTRDLVIDGESKITTILRDKKIYNKFKNILNKIKISHTIVLQALIDKKGRIKIIEINPRVGGATTVSSQDGLDNLIYHIDPEHSKKYSKPINFGLENKKITQFRVYDDFYNS